MPRHPPPRKPKKKRTSAFSRGGAISDPAAHDAVEIAMRDGVLVRPEHCETCGKAPPPLRNGKAAIQAHHDDYNEPLVVRWLCKGCHFRWHQTHTAVPRRGAVESQPGPVAAVTPGHSFDPLDGIVARLRSPRDDMAYLVMALRR